MWVPCERTSQHLVDDERVVNVGLKEVLKRDILHDAAAYVRTRPRLDACTVLCVGHCDISNNRHHERRMAKNMQSCCVHGCYVLDDIKYPWVLTERADRDAATRSVSDAKHAKSIDLLRAIALQVGHKNVCGVYNNVKSNQTGHGG